MKPLFLLPVAFVLLSACLPLKLQPGPPDSNADATTRPAARPPGDAVTADQFDTTTKAERQAALNAAPSGERELGRTIASLGNPANPGFWLETPLVSERVQGRVVYGATGQSVTVDLIPIDGPQSGGSRISLPALRLLGAPLTGLPELTVYAG